MSFELLVEEITKPTPWELEENGWMLDATWLLVNHLPSQPKKWEKSQTVLYLRGIQLVGNCKGKPDDEGKKK